jgi:uncharacterized repeat protein (TIGR01451 family)
MRKTCYWYLLMCASTWAQPTSPARPQNLLAKLPLSFERDSTQKASGPAKYLSRRPGYTVSVNSTSVEVSGRNGMVRMTLIGANRHARIEPLDQLPGTTNYFMGSDPSKWRTDVANFARIAVRDAYPGIDLVFYGNEKQLEYDAIVAPGADPRRIRVKLSPAKNLKRDENGDVTVNAGDVELRLRKPVVFQMVNGEKRPIEGSYALRANGALAFTVGDYDAGKTLVIDPVIVYSSYLGADGNDYCSGVAVDANDNTYVGGSTGAFLYPSVSPGPPSDSAFVMKIDPQGHLVFLTYFGGHGTKVAGIALDSDGNAYVTGVTVENFPAFNGPQLTFGGGQHDAFIVVLKASGTVLYSSYLGGTGADTGTGIAVDSNHYAYVTGYTTGSFPVTNAIQGTYGGGGDAFVVKINAQGTQIVYATYLGGSGYDGGAGIAADSFGNAYVTGTTNSQDFPLMNALQPGFGGLNDLFITKINPLGTALVYSTYLGGLYDDEAGGIALDGNLNVYVTGYASGPGFPTVNAMQPHSGGDVDAIVVKINAQGSALVYSTYLGGIGFDRGNAIAVDSLGNAYVTGQSEVGLPLLDPLPVTLGPGPYHAFFTMLGPTGSLASSTYLSGDGASYSSNSVGSGIAVHGLVRVVGYTFGAAFPVVNGLQPIAGGTQDGFIIAYSPAPNSDNPPNVASVYPSSGMGTDQVFRFTFSGGLSGAGTKPIVTAKMLITPDYSESASCYVSFAAASNMVSLANDSGTFTSGMTIGTAGTLQNSQCILDVGASSVDTYGSTLIVALALSFKPSFVGGKYILMGASNGSAETSWQLRGGLWTVPPSSDPDFSLKLTPDSSSVPVGQPARFTVTVNGRNGFNDAVNFSLRQIPYPYYYFFNPPSVTGSGSSTLTLSPLFENDTGPIMVKLVAANSPSLYHQASALLNIAPSGAPPQLSASVTPSTGTGPSQTFRFTFSDLHGAGEFLRAQVNIGTTLVAAGNCYIYFSGNFIHLSSDDGWLPYTNSAIVGTPGTLQNSQCIVDVGASTVSVSGNDLILTVPIAFTQSFVGSKNIYLEADIEGNGTGWAVHGSFDVTEPEFSLSMSPASTSGYAGRSVGYLVTAQRASGFSGPISLHLSGPPGVTAVFNPPSLTVGTDTSTLTVNTSATTPLGLSTLTVTGTSASLTRSTSVSLNLVPLPPPEVVSVSPSNGSGSAQTFAFTFRDPLSSATIVSIHMLVNSTVSTGGGCYLSFDMNTNSISLADDAGSFHGSSVPGSAGVQQNSQCTIDPAGSSRTFGGGGNDVTLNLALTFKQAFIGAKSVFAKASDGVQETSWVALGSWTVNSVPDAAGSASFVRMDTTTRGNWVGTYGLDGYTVVGDQAFNPPYVTPVPAGQNVAVWASSATDVRALRKASNPSDRIAATWYGANSFTVDLPETDANPHQLALYFLDWDTSERRQTVDILDKNGNVLNSQNLNTSFSGGTYLVWNVTGRVKVRITLTGGANPVLSGVFFGGTTTISPPALQITKTHSGNFTAGQQGATYALTVSNSGSATSGTVTVQETIPFGLSLVAMSGSGWSCGGTSCSRSDTLASGASYPPITVTVNVAAQASSPRVNQVSVSGGGSAVATASDSTVILPTGVVAASASFVKMDTTTQGNWYGTYGIDGRTVVGDYPANPSYVTPVPAGEEYAVWAALPSDVRALTAATPPWRIAATWYAISSFTVDLPMTDANTHQLALYFLDFDTTERREIVDILDDHGNVLNSQNLNASFNGGVYLVWNVSGHVTVRITLTGGANPVLSGIFFAPPGGVVNPSPGAASFVKMDTTTQGTWVGHYGYEGYTVVGDQSLSPSYVTPIPAGQNVAVWAASATDTRALQKTLIPQNRIAATWYGSSFTVDLPEMDTLTHQLALYFLDWDTTARRQTVDILDGNGNVLNSQSLTGSFNGGIYLVWNVSGHVKVRVTLTGGANAVLSGMFFGQGGPVSNPPSAAVAFVKRDTTTQGNWRGAYGADGYTVVGDQALNPSFVVPIPAGQNLAVWAPSATDARALQKGSNPLDRIAATWYGNNSFTVDLPETDTITHQLALYFVDWDTTARRETVDILDGNGNVLDSQDLNTSFTGGVYLVWSISGHVKVRITLTGGANPVLSGLFFH